MVGWGVLIVMSSRSKRREFLVGANEREKRRTIEPNEPLGIDRLICFFLNREEEGMKGTRTRTKMKSMNEVTTKEDGKEAIEGQWR